MKKLLSLNTFNATIIFLALVTLSGCTFMVKTPTVAKYSNLDQISATTSKNDISIMLGTPQGDGVYGAPDKLNPLDFYFGFAGEISTSGADYDSGFAFVSYLKNKPEDLLYFTSKQTGNPIPRGNDITINQFIDSLRLGSTKIEEVLAVIGKPKYTGRRANFSSGINNTIAYWDTSEINPSGAIKEKWLLLGYDKNNVVQDIIWVSSKPEDIKNFGNITEQQLQQISKLVVAGIFPMLDPTGMNTGTKIDPIQVDALIKSNPKNIKDVIETIGLPTALGIKQLAGNSPLGLSNWSFSKIEIKGRETNYIPPEATPEVREKLSSSSFMVMKIDQSRLMIGHTANGDIKEILWIKPSK